MQIVLPPIGIVSVVQNPSKPNSNTNKRDTKYNIVWQKPIPQNFTIKIEIGNAYSTKLHYQNGDYTQIPNYPKPG
jgi:hypothetical protein